MALGTADEAKSLEAFTAFLATIKKPKGRSIADLWDAYCVDKEGKRVLVAMRSEWKSLGPVFGHLLPEHVTVQHSRDYAAARREKKIKDGTIWTELGHLRTVLNWASERGIIEKAPFIELPMKPPPKDRHLTRTEARRLMDSAEMPHIRLYIVLLLTTAARNEAALELTWDRVDFERGVVRLGLFSGQRRKGRGSPPMNDLLREELQTARKSATSPWVIEYAGRRVTTVKRGFNAAVVRSKVAGVTPHVLRHTAAVWMAEAGVPMAEIAQFLGHEDSRITERVYARFSPYHLRKAASSLEF
ncbi:tyrosine-type recombinase/integrase [Acuticoccus sediminis]|uniref:tyrosine-type recombinase/integrase n=1 Tax=Acuticoccus sediminis TaxID=2184697 RepID=UPI001391A508|nr:site-specific integrase [Acuticoccus sediminis]